MLKYALPFSGWMSSILWLSMFVYALRMASVYLDRVHDSIKYLSLCLKWKINKDVESNSSI